MRPPSSFQRNRTHPSLARRANLKHLPPVIKNMKAAAAAVRTRRPLRGARQKVRGRRAQRTRAPIRFSPRRGANAPRRRRVHHHSPTTMAWIRLLKLVCAAATRASGAQAAAATANAATRSLRLLRCARRCPPGRQSNRLLLRLALPRHQLQQRLQRPLRLRHQRQHPARTKRNNLRPLRRSTHGTRCASRRTSIPSFRTFGSTTPHRFSGSSSRSSFEGARLFAYFLSLPSIHSHLFFVAGYPAWFFL